MDGHCPVCLFAYIEKAFHNKIRGGATICEKEIPVLEPPASKAGSFVYAFIQSHYCCHIVFAEITKIGFRSVLTYAINTRIISVINQKKSVTKLVEC